MLSKGRAVALLYAGYSARRSIISMFSDCHGGDGGDGGAVLTKTQWTLRMHALAPT